ncbi:MAG TPA: DNA polymerase III subunit [Kiritimatiellia bacterium]|nr:DNA polymerase III subunit [Kiritimatiellia bacterium]
MLDRVAEAYSDLTNGWMEGRIAHAYLVQGAPGGEAGLFARSMLQWLFCTEEAKPCGRCKGCHRIELRTHPDVMWIEPESRSRQISIEQTRAVCGRLAQTSLEGGWKGAVLLEADRMTQQAANALLKTLEEPPGKSILLLISDAPQAILPTILSRCQNVKLSSSESSASHPWRQELLELLRRLPAGDPVYPLVRAAKLKALLQGIREPSDEEEMVSDDEGQSKEIKEARQKARMVKARTDMISAILIWYRDVLACTADAPESTLQYPEFREELRAQAQALGWGGAMRQIQNIERLYRDVEMNVTDLAAFDTLLPS